MQQSLAMTCGLGLLVCLLATGCSKGDDDDDDSDGPGSELTPSQICSNLAYDVCNKIYECASPAQLRSLGFPQSKLDCSANAIDDLGCTSAVQGKVCAGSAASTAADAASCVSQVTGASCSDVASKQVASYAPACGQCAVKP